MFCGAGEELAVEAAADEKSQALVAKGPYAGEKAAMPEGIYGGGSNIETDASSGLADVFVAKGGSERKCNDAGEPGTDSQEDALLQGVGGVHLLSLPFVRPCSFCYCSMAGR